MVQHQSNFQAVRMKRAELDLEMETQDWEHIDESSAVLSSVGDNVRELIDTPNAGNSFEIGEACLRNAGR